MALGPEVALRIAQGVAGDLVLAISPACARVDVAGSVRRQKPRVHDVELLVIPLATMQADLFGAPLGPVSQLDPLLDHLVGAGRQAQGELWSWGHQPRRGQKWKRLIHVPTGLPCDIFVTTHRAWASNWLVKTGPSGFSQHLMSTALRMGYHFADGFLLHAHPAPCQAGPACERIIETPTERAVMDALGLPWKEPVERNAFPTIPPKPRQHPRLNEEDE